MQIGWIDFSKDDRNIALSVLKLLAKPGAVDEMGIGIIRDGFANILFPGTSTIQTRAKYLFIIPYICMQLEHAQKTSNDINDFVKKLNEYEISLISSLVERCGKGKGIIGEDAGDNLLRKPSSIYWNALKTYEFFAEPSFTLQEYAAAFCYKRNNAEKEKILGRSENNEDDSSDDIDAVMHGTRFWSVPYIQNWQEDLSIDLLKSEAEFLRNKIVKAKKTQNTLLAFLLKENNLDIISKAEKFDDLDSLILEMPQQIQADYILARDFSNFIYGAQLRYNIIYSQNNNKDANEEWKRWSDNKFKVDLDKVFDRLKTKDSLTMNFLRKYKESVRLCPTV